MSRSRQRARSGGCSNDLWLELAAKREQRHPEDALEVYKRQIEHTVARTTNEAYRDAIGLLRKVNALLVQVERKSEFAEHLESVRARFKMKRNFIKLIDRAKMVIRAINEACARGVSRYNRRVTKPVIRVSEADAATDFRSLMAHVRAGAEVVIESGTRAVAVLHAAEPVRRTLSECIELAKAHEKETGKAPVLDADYPCA